MMDSAEKGFAIIFVISILLIAGACIGAIAKQKEWEKFKTDHKCEIVGKMDSSSAPMFGVSSSGGTAWGVQMSSAKTQYKCNDGITYWKDE